MHSKNILTVNEIPRKIKSHFIFLGFYIGTYREVVYMYISRHLEKEVIDASKYYPVDNISFADIIP